MLPRAKAKIRTGVLQVISNEVSLGQKGGPELIEQNSEGVTGLGPCRARARSVGISQSTGCAGPQPVPYKEENLGGAVIMKPTG